METNTFKTSELTVRVNQITNTVEIVKGINVEYGKTISVGETIFSLPYNPNRWNPTTGKTDCREVTDLVTLHMRNLNNDKKTFTKDGIRFQLFCTNDNGNYFQLEVTEGGNFLFNVGFWVMDDLSTICDYDGVFDLSNRVQTALAHFGFNCNELNLA